MIRIYKKKSLLVSILFLQWPVSALPQPQSADLEAGIEDFRQEDYDAALGHFRSAEVSGYSSDALNYNLAVTLYRLGRYDEAIAYFEMLEGNPQWTPLINYNYGLIAQARSDQDSARVYFRRAAQQEQLPRIQEAAERKLAALQDSSTGNVGTAESGPGISGLVSLSAGSDSNPASLSDEFIQGRSEAEDIYSETLGFGQFYLNGRRGDGVRAYGLVFSRQFRDFDNLDALVFGGGMALEKPWSNFETETGFRLTQTRLDSSKVADQLQLKAGATRPTQAGEFSADYFFTVYRASERYQQVDGNQHRVDFGWEKGYGRFSAETRLRYEVNDRDDLRRSNGAFSSYSPTRYEFLLQLGWRFSSRFSTGFSYEYVDARYDGVNRLRDSDGQVKTRRRERTDHQFSLDANYRLDEHWRFKAEIERSEVDDVYNIYTYDKNRLMATVEYQF